MRARACSWLRQAFQTSERATLSPGLSRCSWHRFQALHAVTDTEGVKTHMQAPTSAKTDTRTNEAAAGTGRNLVGLGGRWWPAIHVLLKDTPTTLAAK
jgi:hypothetical protein